MGAAFCVLSTVFMTLPASDGIHLSFPGDLTRMSLFGRISDLFGDTPDAGVDDDPKTRAAIEALTSGLSLYHFYSCPFCARVHRALKKLGIAVELRDVSKDAGHRADLMAGGGRTTVPCLRMENPGDGTVTWMYESQDIIAWFEAAVSEIRAR